MSTLQDHLVGQHVRTLVSRAITCPITGEVLDVRTAERVHTDDPDLPVAVVAPGQGIVALSRLMLDTTMHDREHLKVTGPDGETLVDVVEARELRVGDALDAWHRRPIVSVERFICTNRTQVELALEDDPQLHQLWADTRVVRILPKGE